MKVFDAIYLLHCYAEERNYAVREVLLDIDFGERYSPERNRDYSNDRTYDFFQWPKYYLATGVTDKHKMIEIFCDWIHFVLTRKDSYLTTRQIFEFCLFIHRFDIKDNDKKYECLKVLKRRIKCCIILCLKKSNEYIDFWKTIDWYQLDDLINFDMKRRDGYYRLSDYPFCIIPYFKEVDYVIALGTRATLSNNWYKFVETWFPLTSHMGKKRIAKRTEKQ